MSHEVLKPFSYSHDGITGHAAAVGDVVTLPDHLVHGLTHEGFVRARRGRPPMEAQAFAAAPENQAFESAPENKAEIATADEVAPPSPRRGRPSKAK